MTNAVCVFGLWHLGSVTAACLAAAGIRVVGLDPDPDRTESLARGRPPVAEPRLAALQREGMASGALTFTSDPRTALSEADTLWVTFDTPIDDDDFADPDWVRARLEEVRPAVRPGTLVLISSQVPVGFTSRLESDWRQPDIGLQIACSPENLRLGRAIDAFCNPARVIVGLREDVDRSRITRLFSPFTDRIEWMSTQSAEMTKLALNGFLALSVAYANEVARLSERVGADATEVERGLKSDPRIGPGAYLAPGAPMAGGTLLRDIVYLGELAADKCLENPVIGAVRASNLVHQRWARDRLIELTAGISAPVVAVLGLTYKPGTDTLRRSESIELVRWLGERGATVQAFDPAISTLPSDLDRTELLASARAALRGADVAVLATAWPVFRALEADDIVLAMRRPFLLDQGGFLSFLARDPRITYVRVGRPSPVGGGL